MLGSAVGAELGPVRHRLAAPRATRGRLLLAATGAATLKSVDAKADTLVSSMVETSAQLTGAMRELQLVLAKANTGKGTAARLLNDGTFYENLLENTNQLQALLEEMREFITEWRNKEIKIF